MPDAFSLVSLAGGIGNFTGLYFFVRHRHGDWRRRRRGLHLMLGGSAVSVPAAVVRVVSSPGVLGGRWNEWVSVGLFVVSLGALVYLTARLGSGPPD